MTRVAGKSEEERKEKAKENRERRQNKDRAKQNVLALLE
jgi:hypothetical protein